MDYHFTDFTEESYRALLRTARAEYRLIDYADYRAAGKNCLWRHDIDYSVHRGLRLAQIEAEESIKATYFVLLHSEFYHFGEKTVTAMLREILALGHRLALHFDPSYYDVGDLESFSRWLDYEKQILETLFATTLHAFSIHQPDVGGDWMNLGRDEICGMVNTYGPHLKSEFTYCSDSNGYWRFRRLRDVLAEASAPKLQILTHPAWWTPEAMSPRSRVSRCVDGRAQACHDDYDGFMDLQPDRENVL